MQFFIRERVAGVNTGKHVLLQGVSGLHGSPLYSFRFKSYCYTGTTNLAVMRELHVEGVEVLLGNELEVDRFLSKIHSPVLSVLPIHFVSLNFYNQSMILLQFQLLAVHKQERRGQLVRSP